MVDRLLSIKQATEVLGDISPCLRAPGPWGELASSEQITHGRIDRRGQGSRCGWTGLKKFALNLHPNCTLEVFGVRGFSNGFSK